MTKTAQLRYNVAAVLTAIICLEITISVSIGQIPLLSSFLKPLIAILYIRSLREAWFNVIRMIKDTSTALLVIFSYILAFSVLGFYMFIGTLEGVTYFLDIYDSAFNLLILLTTANFPDIMLPAYSQNPKQTLFFILFLLFGLYFLMNMLLAVFYGSYKRILNEKV